MTFERVPVPRSPVERETLVRLQQRGVPGHVREHHRNKPTIERDTHYAILSAPVRPLCSTTAPRVVVGSEHEAESFLTSSFEATRGTTVLNSRIGNRDGGVL
jgi:hypothetical protein